jgi:hypothetical protein
MTRPHFAIENEKLVTAHIEIAKFRDPFGWFPVLDTRIIQTGLDQEMRELGASLDIVVGRVRLDVIKEIFFIGASPFLILVNCERN